MIRRHHRIVGPAEIEDYGRILRRAGLLRIFPAGQQYWDSWPQAADPTVISARSEQVLGQYAPIIPKNSISIPYALTHLAVIDEVGLSIISKNRVYLRHNGTVCRQIRTWDYNDSGVNTPILRTIPPYPVRDSEVIDAAYQRSRPARGDMLTYLGILYERNFGPIVFPTAPKLDATANQTTTATGTASNSGASAWTWGAYTELNAGHSTGVILTMLHVRQVQASHVQMAFATGSAGNEVDFGIFGAPRQQSTYPGCLLYSLLPYGLYVPPSTRIAFRVRSSSASAISFQASYECLVL